MRLIQSGPRTAKVVVVGEAPGANEDASGIPFSGASGHDLDMDYLPRAGLSRSDVFVTNVVHERPPANDFTKFLKPKPSIHLMAGLIQLKNDLTEIKPNLVLAFGDTPLRFLTGRHSIKKYRGSVLESVLVPGLKVLATYHPAAVFRIWEYRPMIFLDMQRAKEEKEFPEIRNPVRDIRIWPEGAEWVEEMFNAEWLSVDIETEPGPDRHELICVGFSDRADRALVIPVNAPGADLIIRRLLASPARKCGQNFGQYDLTVLEDNGYEVKNFAWDIMYSHHALFMEAASGGDEVKSLRGKTGSTSPFGKGLGFQVSIYTREPFYKDDGKLWNLDGDIRDFYIYNGKDCAVTYEIRTVHERELADFGVRPAFDHEMAILPVLRAMSRTGIKIDLDRRELFRVTLETEISNLQAFLNAAAGSVINVKSAPQIHNLIYNKLGLPPKYKKGTDRPTADKDAIIALAAKHHHPVLMTILEIRKRRDLIERYINAQVDADGRLRCLFDPSGTRTGRLASRANIYGSGTNLQNIPSELRAMFVADPGKVLFYIDLSQAEARVVAWLARSEALISLFESGRDIHKENAIRFFGEYKEENRITVKRIVHGSNYGEGPDKIVVIAAQDGIVLKRDVVVYGQDAYFMMYPEIKENWWREVKEALNWNRTLTTPLGWKRVFYGRWDNVKFFNEALAFQPQCTVGILGEMGMMRASQIPGVQVLLNEHDAIVGQVDEDKVDTLLPLAIQAMQIEFEVFGRPLVIPAEAKIGRNWGDYDEKVNPEGLRKWKTT